MPSTLTFPLRINKGLIHLYLFLSGEDGLCELPESLLRGHGGGDEGDLHQQSHVEAV